MRIVVVIHPQHYRDRGRRQLRKSSGTVRTDDGTTAAASISGTGLAATRARATTADAAARRRSRTAQTPAARHRTGVPGVHRRVFGRRTGARSARPGRVAETTATGRTIRRRRLRNVGPRRLRSDPGGHGLAAGRPAAGRAGRPAGQRVRVRGQEVLQQNDGGTLPEHRGPVHAARQPGTRSRAVRGRRRNDAEDEERRGRRHVRSRLDTGARAAAAAPKFHRLHRKTNRTPDVAAVRPGQTSEPVLQTGQGLVAGRPEVQACPQATSSRSSFRLTTQPVIVLHIPQPPPQPPLPWLCLDSSAKITKARGRLVKRNCVIPSDRACRNP